MTGAMRVYADTVTAVGLIMGFIFGIVQIRSASVESEHTLKRGRWLQYNEVWCRAKRAHEDTWTVHAWIRGYIWVGKPQGLGAGDKEGADPSEYSQILHVNRKHHTYRRDIARSYRSIRKSETAAYDPASTVYSAATVWFRYIDPDHSCTTALSELAPLDPTSAIASKQGKLSAPNFPFLHLPIIFLHQYPSLYNFRDGLFR